MVVNITEEFISMFVRTFCTYVRQKEGNYLKIFLRQLPPTKNRYVINRGCLTVIKCPQYHKESPRGQ